MLPRAGCTQNKSIQHDHFTTGADTHFVAGRFRRFLVTAEPSRGALCRAHNSQSFNMRARRAKVVGGSCRKRYAASVVADRLAVKSAPPAGPGAGPAPLSHRSPLRVLEAPAMAPLGVPPVRLAPSRTAAKPLLGPAAAAPGASSVALCVEGPPSVPPASRSCLSAGGASCCHGSQWQRLIG